ncbi:MAG: transposon-encoded TnpW family protein [Oscillospiraceae bacterium]|jgi:hypothetical protein|nr:transposon-encoded TnpW family protein [Oscillospiraceae bacterium]
MTGINFDETKWREALGNDNFKWLINLPEEELRDMFRELRVPHNIDFRWTIYGTEYEVVSHFNGDSTDDFIKKLKRMITSEVIQP